MHKPSLELLISYASFLGRFLNACVDHLPYTCVCTCFLFKEMKNETSKGSPGLNTGEPNLIIITSSSSNYFLYLFICLFVHPTFYL
jgi:hypothetical protein